MLNFNRNTLIKNLKYFLTAFIIVLSAYSIWFFYNSREEVSSTFDEVTDSGLLKAVIVDYNYNKGYPGPIQDYFEDLCHFLASRLWANLEIIHCSSLREAESMVLSGKAHIFIHTNPASDPDNNLLSYTKPCISASWHLIVNRDNIKLNSISDLKGKSLIVSNKVPFLKEIKLICKKNGVNLKISKRPVKDIFADVEKNKITATIADNLTVRALRYFYPKAVMADSLGFKTPLGFGVAPGAYDFKFRVNLFMDNVLKEDLIKVLTSHYFHKIDVFEYLDIRKFHRRIKSFLPRYMKIIKKYSEENDLDWRLVTAQIYQESHFNKWAKSNAKAKGLMQLLPSTASSLGVSNIYSPEENIKAGIKHLKYLYNLYDKGDKQDRIKISLASYNMGQGHMYDARKISEKMGLAPDKWYNMLRILPLLKKRYYYKKTVYGYAKGDEPVNYVRKIMSFYRVLKGIYKDEAPEPYEEASKKFSK